MRASKCPPTRRRWTQLLRQPSRTTSSPATSSTRLPALSFALKALTACLLALLLSQSCHEQPKAGAGQGRLDNTLSDSKAEASINAKVEAADPSKYSLLFDKKLAWKHLTKIVSFGPRVPNTKSHTVCRNYLERQLEAVCDRVEIQEFEVPLKPEPLKMTNVIGRFNLEQPRRILILSHWDTRPICDMEDDPRLRRIPNDGANDGASGNAVMLELARVFSEKRPDIGVDLLFTDGEDYGPGIDMMFLGAKFFAKRLSDTQVASYNYAILLDMVGDRNQDFHPEYNSEGSAPKLYGVAMKLNRELGYRAFKEQGAYNVLDDHICLMERGLKIYDFIDFNYEPWNKTTDTIDKCSADSLESIGRTIENMIYLYPAIYGEAPK
jgi:hypothetical protein